MRFAVACLIATSQAIKIRSTACPSGDTYKESQDTGLGATHTTQVETNDATTLDGTAGCWYAALAQKKGDVCDADCLAAALAVRVADHAALKKVQSDIIALSTTSAADKATAQEKLDALVALEPILAQKKSTACPSGDTYKESQDTGLGATHTTQVETNDATTLDGTAGCWYAALAQMKGDVCDADCLAAALAVRVADHAALKKVQSDIIALSTTSAADKATAQGKLDALVALEPILAQNKSTACPADWTSSSNTGDFTNAWTINGETCYVAHAEPSPACVSPQVRLRTSDKASLDTATRCYKA